jgi:SPP1 family predicted phage head-tail adaptor
MRAGSLRHRIAVEVQSDAQDEFGGQSGVWSAFAADIPASFEPLTGKESVAGNQETSRVTARFRIRYRAGITAAMRVNLGGRLFEIVAPPIDPRGSGRELHLLTAEIS